MHELPYIHRDYLDPISINALPQVSVAPWREINAEPQSPELGYVVVDVLRLPAVVARIGYRNPSETYESHDLESALEWARQRRPNGYARIGDISYWYGPGGQPASEFPRLPRNLCLPLDYVLKRVARIHRHYRENVQVPRRRVGPGDLA